MAQLKIYSEIIEENQKIFFDNDDGISYQDIQAFLSSIPEDDDVIDIRLHSAGGYCMEGWAIYDALRRSGKTISATIEGECSSIASVILLAAPTERRSAYKNARMLIHNPALEWVDPGFCSNRNTADVIEKMVSNLENQAKNLRDEQDRILDLYVERTGANRKALQSLMDREIYIDTDRMQELGFISTILVPTTASSKRKLTTKNSRNMKKSKNQKVAQKQSAFARFLAKAGIARTVCQVVTAANGDELTVEREDGDPQVGDVASPDGTFVIDDGTEIVVEGGVITAINPPVPDDEPGTEEPNPLDSASVEELKAMKAEIEAKLAELDPEGSKADQEKVVEELTQKVDELETTVAEQAEALRKSASIVNRVEKAGGEEWLNTVLGMKSTFNPTNRRFVSQGTQSSQGAGESKTQKALREKREAAQAKRDKRKL